MHIFFEGLFIIIANFILYTLNQFLFIIFLIYFIQVKILYLILLSVCTLIYQQFLFFKIDGNIKVLIYILLLLYYYSFQQPKIIISFFTEFTIDFSSFRTDLKPDKYLSNTSNLPLLIYQDKVPGSKVENENKKDIKTLFDFNQRLSSYSLTFERGLQYPPSIFNRYSF